MSTYCASSVWRANEASVAATALRGPGKTASSSLTRLAVRFGIPDSRAPQSPTGLLEQRPPAIGVCVRPLPRRTQRALSQRQPRRRPRRRQPADDAATTPTRAATFHDSRLLADGGMNNIMMMSTTFIVRAIVTNRCSGPPAATARAHHAARAGSSSAGTRYFLPRVVAAGSLGPGCRQPHSAAPRSPPAHRPPQRAAKYHL